MAKRSIDVVVSKEILQSGNYAGKELVITYIGHNKDEVFSKENWIKAYNEAIADNYELITINWLGRLLVTTTVTGFNLSKLIG